MEPALGGSSIGRGGASLPCSDEQPNPAGHKLRDGSRWNGVPPSPRSQNKQTRGTFQSTTTTVRSLWYCCDFVGGCLVFIPGVASTTTVYAGPCLQHKALRGKRTELPPHRDAHLRTPRHMARCFAIPSSLLSRERLQYSHIQPVVLPSSLLPCPFVICFSSQCWFKNMIASITILFKNTINPLLGSDGTS